MLSGRGRGGKGVPGKAEGDGFFLIMINAELFIVYI